MKNWRIVGWAATAGAFLSAASWGWFESSTRSKIEEDRERAHDRLSATVQTLAETQKNSDAFERKLADVQTEQKDLSRRFVESQLRHRTAEDSWLTDKNALLTRIEQLEGKLTQAEEKLLAEKEALQQEQVRRARTEAVLAAERDVTGEATLRWRQERAAANELTRKQNDTIQGLQKDLLKAQTRLESDQDAVKQLETDLSKTLNERDAAAVASQQTGAALDQAVTDLQKREYDVYALRNTIAQLLAKLTRSSQEAQRLHRTNQQLVKQIQQLQAQVNALQKQLVRPPAKPLAKPPAKPGAAAP